MSEAPPAAKYAERSRQLDMDMLIYRVPDQLRRVIVAVRLLSWDKNRDAAPIGEMVALAIATHIHPGDLSRALQEGKKMKLLRVERLAGSWWLELLPDTAVWLDRSTTKVDGKRESKKKSKCAPAEEEVMAAKMAWRILNEDGDPGQVKLPMEVKPSHPPLGDAGFGDAMAETSREAADEKIWEEAAAKAVAHLGNSQVAGTGGPPHLGNSQLAGQNPNSSDLGNSQVTHAGAGAPAYHGHGTCTPSVPQSMVPCDHGQSFAEEDRFAGMGIEDLEELLPKESQHWYRQLEEIFGDSAAEDFRLTWLKRLCDRWDNCAWRAIGEVKRMKLKGEHFTKGPGQYANFLFNKYRYASWKSARVKEEKAKS